MHVHEHKGGGKQENGFFLGDTLTSGTKTVHQDKEYSSAILKIQNSCKNFTMDQTSKF